MRFRRALAGLAVVVALAGCGDDQEAGPPPADPLPERSELPGHGGTEEADPGDLEVPDIEGTTFAPFPSLGFGIAVPEGWNATRLDDEAFERLEEADLAQPFFLDAARNVAETGAVFYAAGVDEEGRVAEIKVEPQGGSGPELAALADAAAAEALAAGGTEVNVVQADGRARVDFRLQQRTADGGEPIDTYVSRLLVPDGEQVWSIVVTSEDPASQSAVLEVVDAGFVLA